MIDNALIAIGLLIVVYGLIGLVGVWLVPAIANSRFYGSNIFAGRMEPTHVTRTVMALWYLLFGGCLVSLSSGHRTLGNVLLVAFSLGIIAALFIRYRHRSEV